MPKNNKSLMKLIRIIVRTLESKVVTTIIHGSPICRRAEDFFPLIADLCDSVKFF